MAVKKPSGLDRGLGELLEDNTPEIREGRGSVVVKNEGGTIKITPTSTSPSATKQLFETKPKNRSVKSNFKK